MRRYSHHGGGQILELVYQDVLVAVGHFGELRAVGSHSERWFRHKVHEVDRYQHILVDEFQDLTTAMMAVTTQLSVNAQSLWVVGDVRQAIYHWRGASLDALLGFEDRFASAKRYDLVVNRRSVQEVVALTVSVGQSHPLQTRLPLPAPKCKRGSTGRAPPCVAGKLCQFTRASMFDR